MPNHKQYFDEVNISESMGVRYLHLGHTPWIQGAMRIARPWKLEIEYIQDMMACHNYITQHNITPSHIVQLGLGAASLTKHCYRQYPHSKITAIEINPHVIAACRQWFKLMPNDARLTVLQSCASKWVYDINNHHTVDILHVDLYDSEAKAPLFNSVEFYEACRLCLTDHGIMMINVFGDLNVIEFDNNEINNEIKKNKAQKKSDVLSRNGDFKGSYTMISTAFKGLCFALPQTEAGNVVIMAFREAFEPFQLLPL